MYKRQVLAAVKPLEQKYKVYSYPLSRKVIDSDIITTKKVYNGQESEISKFFMRVETCLLYTSFAISVASQAGSGWVYCAVTVSYTHLDVYKRQGERCQRIQVDTPRELEDVDTRQALEENGSEA